MIGMGEVVFLVGLVAVLFWALAPLRRRLEAWIERHLPRRTGARRGRVVVLERRKDGTFGRGNGDDGG